MTGDRVLIQQKPKQDKTSGGILLPVAAQEQHNAGRVLAVGPGLTSPKGVLLPVDVKPGDWVLYNAHGGIPISLDGHDYLSTDARNIFLVVDDEYIDPDREINLLRKLYEADAIIDVDCMLTKEVEELLA